MTRRGFSRIRAGMGIVLIVGLAACSRLEDSHGYVPDDALLAQVEVGVDTKDTVARILGRPGTAGIIDERGWSRRRTVWTAGALTLVVGLPSALAWAGMAPLATVSIFGKAGFFSFMDFVWVNVSLPLGALLLEIVDVQGPFADSAISISLIQHASLLALDSFVGIQRPRRRSPDRVSFMG